MSGVKCDESSMYYTQQPEWIFLFPFSLFGGFHLLLGTLLMMATDWARHCCIRTGANYLVLLSAPPQVFHCLQQIQSQELGLVSSPLFGALVVQTCPHPDEPPPGSCSGTRDCNRKGDKIDISCFLSSLLFFCHIGKHCFWRQCLQKKNVKFYIFIHHNCNTSL